MQQYRSLVFVLLVSVVGVISVSAGGQPEGQEGQGRETPPVRPSEEHVTPPEWVTYIQNNEYEKLYSEGAGPEYIGVGIGASREEALAAAAVDFAGNVSTEVDASVVESGDAQSSEDFDVRIRSEVRSQAIISGLEPKVWEDTRTDVVYTMYRTSATEYQQRLEEWTATIASISEAERKREIQRLEDQRAAAERRREEIELEKLRDQVRLADRQMRADRHRSFLYMPIPSRERNVLTPYQPPETEITGAFRGAFKEYGIDGALDRRFGKIFRLGLDVEGIQNRDVDENDKDDNDDQDAERYYGAGTARLDVRLLDRVGWVTSTSLAAGVYGGGYIDGDLEPEWAFGPFLTADVILPEFFHTRWGAYIGTDLTHIRAAWYPFWDSIENALGVHAAGQFTWGKYGNTLQPAYDRNYAGIGVSFQPINGFWVTFETRNISSVRGSLTISY